MASVAEQNKGQDAAGQQRIPVLWRYLDPVGPYDENSPAQLSPFTAGPNGGLFVTVLGGSGAPVLLPDNVDDVAPTADDDRLPTVARLYGFDPAAGEFDRLRTDDDQLNASDAESEPALRVMNRGRVYNGFDNIWYLQRGQDSVDVAPSLARTATFSTGNLVNPNWRAAHFILDITAGAGFDIEFTLEARNQLTAGFYPLLSSGSIIATGTTVFKIGIGFTEIANLTANDLLPYIYRVTMTHNNASSVTYSIAANLSV